MKRSRFGTILILLFAMALAVPVGVSADPPAPYGPYEWAANITSRDASDGICQLRVYDAAGSQVFSTGDIFIPAGVTIPVSNLNLEGLAAGIYSGVVKCDVNVDVSALVMNEYSRAAFNTTKPSETGTPLYAPSIYDNYYGFYTTVVVQNASSTAKSVTVYYYAPGQSSAIDYETQTIPAYASRTFYQAGRTNLLNNVSYSARIVGTGNLAAEVNIYGSGAAIDQLYAYRPFKQGAAKLYAPVVMKSYYGLNTALTVMNVGGVAALVNVEYEAGGVESMSIPANSSVVFYTPSSNLPNGTLTSATITSVYNVPIVAMVNESNSYNRAATYEAFSGGSRYVVAPDLAKRRWNENSSLTCQNVGSGYTAMTVTYEGYSSNPYTTPFIAPGDSYMFYLPSPIYMLHDGWAGSAGVYSTNSDIVCVANQDFNEDYWVTLSGDFLSSYNAIP